MLYREDVLVNTMFRTATRLVKVAPKVPKPKPKVKIKKRGRDRDIAYETKKARELLLKTS